MRGGKQIKRGYLARYTALFLLVSVPSALCLLVSGKTFLWRLDAYYQHYPALGYVGQAVRSLLSGEGFKMVDLSLGQGLDTVGTLAYYGLFNPIHYLAALFSGDALEIFYQALIFFYMYLSGALMCRYLKLTGVVRDEKRILPLAGLVFAFCGYNAMALIKHPYFASGPIFLLLMLISVERVFQGRSFVRLSLVTALMLCVNFYFGFQTTLMTVIYILVRLAYRLRRAGVKRSAKQGFGLLGGYLLGFAASMAVLLPVIVAFADSARTGESAGYTASMLHYPAAYYLKLVMLFCAPYDYAGYWSLQSFSPLAFFALLLLFSRNQHYALGEEVTLKRQLRAGFTAALACLCVPAAGRIFNGLGYVTNRFSYGYAFIVCVVTGWALEKILAPDYPSRKKMGAAGLVWAALMLAFALVAHELPALDNSGTNFEIAGRTVRSANLAPAAGGLALGAASLCLMKLDKPLRLGREGARRAVLLLTAFCCLAYNLGYAVVAAVSDDFHEQGVYQAVENQAAAAAGEIEDDGFYRVDAGIWPDSYAAMLGYHGTSHYWSMIPSWITRHYIDLETPTLRYAFRVEGLGSDAYLDGLASVGYALRNRQETQTIVPTGYTLVDAVEQADGDTVEIYRNEYALPMGYVFEETLSETEYAALDPIRKRMALAECAVLADADAQDCGLAAFSGELSTQTLEWEVVDAEDAVLANGEIISRAGGSLTLRFESEAECEVYLRVVSPVLLETQEEASLGVRVYTPNGVNRMYIVNPEGNFNFEQSGLTVALGAYDAGENEVTLVFPSACNIQFDGIQFIGVSTAHYRQAMEKLLDRPDFSPEIENNRLSGEIEMQNDGVLQISVPWNRGWTATVDGQEAELMRCGGMYMGLRLSAGAHEITLEYETVGLRAGAWISLAALTFTAAVYALVRLRRARLARAL